MLHTALKFVPGNPLPKPQAAVPQYGTVIPIGLWRGRAPAALIVWAARAEDVRTCGQFDVRLRCGSQASDDARHILDKRRAITLSRKVPDAEPVVGPQPYGLPVHTETAIPALDSVLRSTGTNRAATAILAASPGRKGTTHSNRDSTRPVCATTIYQAVPNR